ncbi:MAG: taurine catabolism dioxygenase TauD [Rhodospirillales bacterium CG15_BIG_FIL_POST_REV_8_21_14_020_66_15]|nr:MAG: taurine catabolism dioxygenase TauD [Rhodospirillales bacterium CG15_BIG_FIL_POST_REV_8_21_14_020_66_15]
MTTAAIEPLQPAEGPSCWTGPQLAGSGSWVVELTDADRADILRALDATDGREALDLSADDFPIGAFAEKLAALREDVAFGTGFAMVRTGLDALDEQAARRLIWGAGQYLGVPQIQDASRTLLHDIRDTGADIDKQDNIRTYQTNREQPFHNDGGDIFALFCRRRSPDGGQSLIVSAHAVFNEILRRRPDLARVLTEPFYFDARGQALPGRPWYQALPIFQNHGGRWFVMYKRHYIEYAQRSPEIPRLTDAQVEAMDLLDELCLDPQFHMAFEMSPGDLVVGNNFTTLHARTAYKDPDPTAGGDKRHMLRLWLGVQGGVALPPVFAETREFGPLFETTDRIAV